MVIRGWVCVVVSVSVLAAVGTGLVAQSAQSISERVYVLTLRADDHARRLNSLEVANATEAAAGLGTRVALLEASMTEIKWLSRTVAGGFLAYMVMGFMNLLRRRNGHGSGDDGP